MYGLTRIVLLNSFIPNRLCQADCEGNTNFSGDNGSGKSSILRLIPFFWGAEPFNLYRPVSGKKTFINWYLPHNSSMLIFEYQREDGPCFVMVYRHPTREAPVYRFAKGIFDPALIGASSTGSFKSLNAAEIIHAFNSYGYDVSGQIESVAHYRAIVQHDRQLLKEHDKKGNLKQLALRYSVPGPQGNMRHMEKLTQAVLKRSKLLESLKVMIASILKEQSIAIPTQPSHSENERVREDLSCLRGFSQKREYFRGVVNDFHEKIRISTRLIAISGQLQSKEQNHKIEFASLEAMLESCAQKLNELEEIHTEKFRILSKTKIENENVRNNARDNVNQLEKEREEWDAKNISTLRNESDHLQHYKIDLEQTKERKRLMLSDIEKIKYNYDTMVEQEKHNHKTFLVGASERLISIAHHKTTINTELHKQLQEFNERKVSEKEAIKLSFSGEIENQISLISIEETRSHNISETEEHRRDLAAHEQSLEDLAAKLYSCQQEIQKCENDCLTTNNSYKNALRDLETSNKNIASFDKRLADLQSQLEPANNTFLAALKENDPDWHNTIGKVISSSVLYMVDLEPTKEDNTKNFYGWSINLENIDLPAHAKSDAQIKDEIQTIDGLLQRERSNYLKYEKITQNFLSAWNTAKNNKDEIIRQESHLKSLQQQQTIQLKRLKAQIDDYRYEQKKLAITAAANATNNLQQLRLLLALKEKEIDDRFLSLVKQEQQIANTQLEDNAFRQKNIEQEKSEAEKRHNLKLETINKDFLDACETQGYDKSAIEKIEKEIVELSNRVKRIEGYTNIIDRYERWEQSEWIKYNEYRRTIQVSEESISTIIDEIGHDERLFKSQKAQLISQKKETSSSISRLEDDLHEIDIVLKRIGRISLPQTSTEKSLSEILSEANTFFDRDTELKSSIQKGMSGAREIIERFPKSELRSAWEALCQKRASMAGLEISDPKLTESLPQDLEYLIDNSLPQLQKVTIEKVRAIGYQLANLYSGFLQIKQNINSLGRKIDEAIQFNQIIENLKDIHIEIQPTIERQEFWNEILVFNQHWAKWQTTNPSELPAIDLEISLSDALSTLKVARISDQLDSYFSMSIVLTENGERRHIYNDSDLNESSSNGLSYLAICILFRGLTRFLCADDKIKIHWPIDELAILSPQNITKLFKMLNDSGIYFFSGFPSTDPHLLNHFDRRKLIDMRVGIKQIKPNMPPRLQRQIK